MIFMIVSAPNTGCPGNAAAWERSVGPPLLPCRVSRLDSGPGPHRFQVKVELVKLNVGEKSFQSDPSDFDPSPLWADSPSQEVGGA